MAGNYFHDIVSDHDSIRQAIYKLAEAAALRFGITVAKDVGYACQMQSPEHIAGLLDEGKTDEICRLGKTYLESLLK